MSSEILSTSADNIALVTAYETLGLNVDEIALAFECEAAAVKGILLAHSKKYRGDITARSKNGETSKDDITDDEFEKINKAYINLALYSDNDTVREKALRTLRDEKRNRLPAQLKTRGDNIRAVQVNVLKFNDLLKAQKELEKAATPNYIDVESIPR